MVACGTNNDTDCALICDSNGSSTTRQSLTDIMLVSYIRQHDAVIDVLLVDLVTAPRPGYWILQEASMLP